MNKKILDLIYLAGLVDGEGYIGICSSQTNKKIYNSIHFGIKMYKGRDILKYFYNKFGGYLYLEKPKGFNVNYTIWKITHKKEMRELLIQVVPFLRLKNKQAKLMLEFLPLLNNHGFNKYLTKEEKKKRKIIYNKMKKLNRLNKRIAPQPKGVLWKKRIIKR